MKPEKTEQILKEITERYPDLDDWGLADDK